MILDHGRDCDYETVDVSPKTIVETTTHTYTESQWMVCVNGIDRTAWEQHRVTGETRRLDYETVMQEFFHAQT